MAICLPDCLPPIEEEDRTFFINKKIFDVLPITLAKVASWGGKKPRNQSFKDCMKIGRKNSYGKLGKLINQNKFSFRGFDIPFICPRLTLMCDKIAEVGSVDWKTRIRDETKVECQMNKIRELRNAVMHYPHGKAVDNTLSDELENIILRFLDNARMMYNISPRVADQAKNEVKESIAKIKCTVLSEKEKVILQYGKLIIKED